MRLRDRAVLVASGRLGMTITDPYDCNAYLVDGGDELGLFDTGAGRDVDLLLARVAAAGHDPGRIAKIFLTHKHADHAGGTAWLTRETGAVVYSSAETAQAVADGELFTRNLARAKRNGAYPGDYDFEGFDVDVQLAGGDVVELGDLTISVFETPGHCSGHLSFGYVADGRHVLLSGDALLPLGQVVMQPIPDCSPAETVASVESLAEAPWDVLLAGHLAPVLDGAEWHVEAAMARIRHGSLPNSLYIPTHRSEVFER